MSDEFDIEKFAEEVSELHPELAEELEDGSPDSFRPEKYEEQLAEQFPELARKICELDEQMIQGGIGVSKKQQARDRKDRLESMVSDGRTLYEGTTSYHSDILESAGPMSLLANAVRNRKRIEVRIRSSVRIDRIFEGIPTTFDEHFNIFMNDVTETVSYGRKAKQEVGLRNQLQELLPPFLRWQKGGKWPMPIGANRLIEHRILRSSFVKGDSVVLIRLLP